jgi:hypothetical protein
MRNNVVLTGAFVKRLVDRLSDRLAYEKGEAEVKALRADIRALNVALCYGTMVHPDVGTNNPLPVAIETVQ